ncbi:MAG: BMP family ABC transporter substrate-binding protein [Paraprevotella sp.]|nr:BMP family ABC transporter substrate-binding protein [Paraprevotella sp.]
MSLKTWSKKKIIILFSPGGLGDQGYNDLILKGVQLFKKQWYDRADVYIYCPKTTEEGSLVFSDWLAKPESSVPTLLVAASNDYEPVMKKCLAQDTLTANKQVLLFESSNPDNLPITTFQISMFGPSYIAGKTVKLLGLTSPLIVLANPNDGPIKTAAEGFKAGFGNGTETEYLADDWNGYIAAQQTYQKMSSWSSSHDFIFPVAGGSNAGIYRYSRDVTQSPLLAGMDVDQSNLSTYIIGSVIKNIDLTIVEYLTQWTETGQLPKSKIYGLESDYSDWQVAFGYLQLEEIKRNVFQEAIQQERNYHEGL